MRSLGIQGRAPGLRQLFETRLRQEGRVASVDPEARHGEAAQKNEASQMCSRPLNFVPLREARPREALCSFKLA